MIISMIKIEFAHGRMQEFFCLNQVNNETNNIE